ncbi:MAG: PspC domain-containing protein [Chloroflexota bacterium]
MEKKLVRVDKGRMIAGVCTGLGAYFGVDPTLIRVIFVVLSILGFLIGGVLLYAVLWAIMPMEA